MRINRAEYFQFLLFPFSHSAPHVRTINARSLKCRWRWSRIFFSVFFCVGEWYSPSSLLARITASGFAPNHSHSYTHYTNTSTKWLMAHSWIIYICKIAKEKYAFFCRQLKETKWCKWYYLRWVIRVNMFRKQRRNKENECMQFLYTLSSRQEVEHHADDGVAWFTIKYFYRIYVRNIFFMAGFRPRVSATHNVLFSFPNKRPARDGICVKCDACNKNSRENDNFGMNIWMDETKMGIKICARRVCI